MNVKKNQVLMKPSVVAEVFDVSTATLKNWAKNGHLVEIRTPSGQTRYTVESVQKLVDQQTSVEKVL